jgi:hypothetical protein
MSEVNFYHPYQENLLVFSSPQEFYFYLKQRDLDFPQLHAFMDNMDLFLNGCPCEAETYWGHVMDEYRYFRRRDFKDIKEKLQCEKIEFSYDNLKFFV